MTRLEVIVVIALVIVLGIVMLVARPEAKKKAQKINCVNNLKQIGLNFRIWEGDHHFMYPMWVSITNGGSMEMVQTGNVLQTFMVVSDDMTSIRILHCPNDKAHMEAKTFDSLSNSNISYFVNLLGGEESPQEVLTGDSNLEINGKPVKSGLVSIWTNDVVTWQPNRHGKSGNLGMADGSVQSATSRSLQSYFTQAGVATNRLAIP